MMIRTCQIRDYLFDCGWYWAATIGRELSETFKFSHFFVRDRYSASSRLWETIEFCSTERSRIYQTEWNEDYFMHMLTFFSVEFNINSSHDHNLFTVASLLVHLLCVVFRFSFHSPFRLIESNWVCNFALWFVLEEG